MPARISSPARSHTSSRFSLVNETSATLPRVAFRVMAAAALGKTYRLTLVITSAARMKKLNAIYRDKDEPTDILSFPLTAREGEMYICLSEARKEAGRFDRTYANFLAFLFIHGCVHLKGHDHGAIMESVEAKLRKRFKI